MRSTSLSILVLAAAASAQTTTLPASASGIAGNGSNAFPWGSNASAFPGLRIQCIYDSANLTGAPVPITTPILITNVRWRANDVATTTTWAGGVYTSAKLGLGTAAVDHASATTNFEANMGPDYMVVHEGPVTVVAGAGNGTGVVGPFVVDIAVNPPFYYDPNVGDLIVDTDFANGAYVGGSLIAMDVHTVTPLARRVFSSSNWPLANGVDSAAPVIELAFTPVPPGTPASNSRIGAGCYKIDDASTYELFSTASPFDLANSAITLLRTPDGYLAMPGVTSYVTPSGSATTLALADNSAVTVPLSVPMPVGRKTTSSLRVCSNGFITTPASTTTTGTASATTFLNNLGAFWALCWFDLNPAAAGSGVVKFEEIGGIAYVTWEGVYHNGGTTPAAANTMQAQFELATGTVHYVYDTMSTGGSAARLVGFSDAGGSPNPGSMDISAALPATFTAAQFRQNGLSVGPKGRPVLGTNWNLETGDVPAGTVLGLDVFGVADFGVDDLFFLGLPGCGLRATLDVLNAWLPGGPAHSYSLPIPVSAGLIGISIYTTGAAFVPGVNAFGAVTGNAVRGTLGDV